VSENPTIRQPIVAEKTAAARPKTIKFGGYYANGVKKHDPELTETDPGTAAGEYMRRFWHPVCMSIELTDTPLFLKIFGEELVAFRDKSGRIGLLHAHCAHRGASLEYGIIQDRGIMCCYHGMVWDIDGSCLHVPFPPGEEKEAQAYAKSVCQGAYRAFERDGLVFAYMGPPEEEPPFPEWEGDFTVAQGDELVAYSNFQHCNWLQVQDKAADNFHTMALHSSKSVVDGHYQGTTFDESGSSLDVAPDLQFFPVQNGTGLACVGARRVSNERLFVRIQHQVLPNISLHAYVSEDGKERKHFSRINMIRWVVPVDDENCKMIGWRILGPTIDPRGAGDKSLVGYETVDFLEGQVAMRRPERFGKYKLEDLPPIPKDHRARDCYKDAQRAPGDYEAVVSQRPIAIHAMENPTKLDKGVFMLRKLLRDAIRSSNVSATPGAMRQWMESVSGQPNTVCSGNVLEIPVAPTVDEEVSRRRLVSRQLIEALIQAESLIGSDRTQFVRKRMQEIEAQFAPT